MKVSTMLVVTSYSYCWVFADIRGEMWRAIGLDIVHADVICYIYKLYALYRVFRHRFEYPEHRVHNQMNYM